MSRTIGVAKVACLVAAAGVAFAQDPPPKAEPEVEPGQRLRVQFVATRQRGEAKPSSRSYAVMLHADAGTGRMFTGTQVALSAKTGSTPATSFKNAGVEIQATVRTRPDGRYRLDVRFEDSSVLAPAGRGQGSDVTGDNPLLGVVRGEATAVLRSGETVPLVSAVDPTTGDVVRVDVSLEAAAGRPAAAAARAADGARPLRARLVLTRRQGDRVLARRPYAVVLGGESDAPSSVFSGSMLPVQMLFQGQPTVMLKDVGAGLRLKTGRLADGRHRLSLQFNDGVLEPAVPAPRVLVFEFESLLAVAEGETVAIASAVEPVSGETVDVELTIEGAQ